LFGHLASAFVIMPFYPWRYIHADHHVWTGWRDLDPTMGQLRPRELSSVARRTADFCWKAWIPVFCLTFSAGNFWNLRRLRRQWKSGKPRREFLFSILFLVMCDPLLLSQNAHIPKKSSGGVKVAPRSMRRTNTRAACCSRAGFRNGSCSTSTGTASITSSRTFPSTDWESSGNG